MLFVLVWLYSATSNDTLLEAIGLVVSKTQGADFALKSCGVKFFFHFFPKIHFSKSNFFLFICKLSPVWLYRQFYAEF